MLDSSPPLPSVYLDSKNQKAATLEDVELGSIHRTDLCGNGSSGPFSANSTPSRSRQFLIYVVSRVLMLRHDSMMITRSMCAYNSFNQPAHIEKMTE